jgi:hypothetical protein
LGSYSIPHLLFHLNSLTLSRIHVLAQSSHLSSGFLYHHTSEKLTHQLLFHLLFHLTFFYLHPALLIQIQSKKFLFPNKCSFLPVLIHSKVRFLTQDIYYKALLLHFLLTFESPLLSVITSSLIQFLHSYDSHMHTHTYCTLQHSLFYFNPSLSAASRGVDPLFLTQD